jgi:chemotaxis response regulator CheB
MRAALLVKSALLRVFVVEDSALIRRRIIDNVQAMGGFDVVGFAESEEEAIEAIRMSSLPTSG